MGLLNLDTSAQAVFTVNEICIGTWRSFHVWNPSADRHVTHRSQTAAFHNPSRLIFWGGGGGRGGRRGRRGNSLPFTTLADWFDFWGGGGGGRGRRGNSPHQTSHCQPNNLSLMHYLSPQQPFWKEYLFAHYTTQSQHPLIQNGKHWSCQHVLRSFEVRETVKTLPLVIAEHQALLLYPPFARGTLDSPKPPPPAPSPLSLSLSLSSTHYKHVYNVKSDLPQEQHVKHLVWYRLPMAWQASLAPVTFSWQVRHWPAKVTTHKIVSNKWQLRS